MDYLSIFYKWLLLVTYAAGVTYAVKIFAVQKKYSKETITLHFAHWFLLPLVYAFWVLSSIFILLFRKDKRAKISYNANLILKRMFADWDEKQKTVCDCQHPNNGLMSIYCKIHNENPLTNEE